MPVTAFILRYHCNGPRPPQWAYEELISSGCRQGGGLFFCRFQEKSRTKSAFYHFFFQQKECQHDGHINTSSWEQILVTFFARPSRSRFLPDAMCSLLCIPSLPLALYGRRSSLITWLFCAINAARAHPRMNCDIQVCVHPRGYVVLERESR